MAIVMITGSNSGFGLAAAVGFLTRGDTVVAGIRRPEAGEVFRTEAARSGGELEIVQLDVTDPASRATAVHHTLERFGRIDVLVNNAGVSHIGAFEDTPPATLEQVLDTNLLGPLELTRLVLPTMRSQGAGRIVNVTAIGAVLCTPFLTGYVASKHGLDAATAALDLEVRPFGIRAVSVLPGPFRTAIADAAQPIDSAPYQASAGRFRAGILQRIADAPSDLGRVVEAIVQGATSPDPPQRAVVASEVMTATLAPAVSILDDLHRAEAERLGLT